MKANTLAERRIVDHLGIMFNTAKLNIEMNGAEAIITDGNGDVFHAVYDKDIDIVYLKTPIQAAT